MARLLRVAQLQSGDDVIQYVQQYAFDVFAPDPRHRVVSSVDEFWSIIRWLEQQPEIAVDTETSGLEWFKHSRIIGVSVAAPRADGLPQCWYFPCRHQTNDVQLPPDVVFSGIRQLLENPRIAKRFHNIKFDEHLLRRENIRVLGPRRDVMIEAHIYDENNLIGLKERAAIDLRDTSAHVFDSIKERELARLAKDVGMTKTAFRNLYGYARLSPMLCGTYAAWDVDFTWRLGEFYDERGVRSFFKDIYATEMDLTEVLHDVEETGQPLNIDHFKWLGQTMESELALLKPQVISAAGGYEFDPGSDAELLHVLQVKLGLHLTKLTDRGAVSVDEEVLSSFAKSVPLCALMVKWRERSKILSTYTYKLIDRVGWDGMLHGDFQQVGTVTGRLASRRPNMQNFSGDSDERAELFTGLKLGKGGRDPWSVKRGFVNRGPEWCSLYADYSQIELRVLAELSQDPVMLDVYLRNLDIHDATSMRVFKTVEKAVRRKAKIINFGLSYCMGPGGYARNAGVSYDEAERDFGIFFKEYPRIAPFREEFWAFVRSNGNQFQNLFGRPRRIPGMAQLRPKPTSYTRAERQCIGSAVQGTAAELTKVSMVRIHKWKKATGAPLLLVGTIHDEVKMDVEKRSAQEITRAIVPLMERFHQFKSVPIRVEVEYSDTDWSEKKHLPEGWVQHAEFPLAS